MKFIKIEDEKKKIKCNVASSTDHLHLFPYIIKDKIIVETHKLVSIPTKRGTGKTQLSIRNQFLGYHMIIN